MRAVEARGGADRARLYRRRPDRRDRRPAQTLLAWTGLLSQATPGHVWVSQPHNQIVAQMGELSAETLHRKGVLGAVVDGGLRDTSFILRLGFPCWGTFHTPRDVVGCSAAHGHR